MATNVQEYEYTMNENVETSQNTTEDRVFSRKGYFFFTAIKTGFWTLVAALILTIANLGIIPSILGYTPLTVLTPSMEPTLKTGDLIWVDSTPKQYQIGDIVSYYPEPNDPTLYTHRIVGLTSSGGFVTHGDNNAVEDEPIIAEQIAGNVVEPYTSVIRGKYTIPAIINENRIAFIVGLGVLGGTALLFGNRIERAMIWRKTS